jgi:hypothetical protein
MEDDISTQDMRKPVIRISLKAKNAVTNWSSTEAPTMTPANVFVSIDCCSFSHLTTFRGILITVFSSMTVLHNSGSAGRSHIAKKQNLLQSWGFSQPKGGSMRKTVLTLTAVLALSLVTGTVFAATDPEFAKAARYYHQGNYAKAAEGLKEYVKKRPDPTAYCFLRYSHYELGKHDEAMEYFDEAYLLDPELSLEKEGLLKKGLVKEVKATPVGERPQKPEPVLPQALQAVTERPQAIPPAAPAPSEVKPVKPEPLKPEIGKPQQPVQPSETVKQLPSAPRNFPKPEMDRIGAPGLPGWLATFGLIVNILGIVLYLFFSFCLYRIAKKLNVPAAWTAWIPIVQIWTIVACAGKPWWWILLLLIPIVNVIVVAYLWMCITENLGRDKWLGLISLIPVIGMIWIAVLAFSKSEGTEFEPEGVA